MTNTFTLEDLDAAIEQQFNPFVFVAGDEEFKLRNVVRLGEKERNIVLDQLKAMEDLQQAEEDGTLNIKDVVSVIQTILKTVTADGKGAKLVKVVGDDPMRNRVLLEKWMEATQTGEAQRSSV